MTGIITLIRWHILPVDREAKHTPNFDLFKLQQINGIVLNKRQASAFD